MSLGNILHTYITYISAKGQWPRKKTSAELLCTNRVLSIGKAKDGGRSRVAATFLSQNLLVVENFKHYQWILQPRKPIMGHNAVSSMFLQNLLAITQNLLVLETFWYHHWIQQPQKPILGDKAVSPMIKAVHWGNLHFFGLRTFRLGKSDQISKWPFAIFPIP